MTEGAPGVPPGGGLSDEDAKAKIVSIKKEIDEGRPFGECAKAYSDCPSGARGGDLGYFPRYAAMVEPFAEAAYALKVGKVSEPVKTRFGYHLIMTTDRRKTSDEKKALAKTRLRNLKVVELLKEIRETVKVERFYKQDAAETQETPTENTD